MITISNDGPLIAATNYWDTAHASAGLFFVSWNAGAMRLLVPDAQRSALAEMLTGRELIVTRGMLDGVDTLELMFDDGSDSPYALHIDMRQTDRAIADNGATFTASAWTRSGLAAQWPARYRVAETLPDLRPWGAP